MAQDPDITKLWNRVHWLVSESEDISNCIARSNNRTTQLERRLKNLEGAFAGVSFLFVVHLVLDLLGRL